MPPEIAEGIAVVFTIVSVGTMILIGMKMRLNARLHGSSDKHHEEIERLGDAVDGLHEQVRLMRDEFAELHERVDFTERMLSSGGTRPSDHGAPTPQ